MRGDLLCKGLATRLTRSSRAAFLADGSEIGSSPLGSYAATSLADLGHVVQAGGFLPSLAGNRPDAFRIH